MVMQCQICKQIQTDGVLFTPFLFIKSLHPQVLELESWKWKVVWNVDV